MSAERLAILLRLLGACKPSRAWCKGKTLRQAWNECGNGEWLDWFWHTISKGSPPAEWVLVVCDSPPPDPVGFGAHGCTTSCTTSAYTVHRTHLSWSAADIRKQHKLSKVISAANRALRRLSQC